MQLVLNGPLNVTSYGYTTSYLFRELLRNEVDVQYFPIGPVSPEPKFVESLQNYLNPNELLSPKTNCLKIWHQHSLAQTIGNGKKIGFPIFELDSFNERERAHLSSCDVLIVCSEWAKQVLQDQKIEVPTYVVPLGVDEEVFTPQQSNYQKDGGTYVFANFGKWEIRKGHDVLLKVFNETFKEDDDVELWMFPHNFHLTPQQTSSWIKYYQSSKLGNKIKIHPRVATQNDLAYFMGQVDCGLFPSRAEGWNLEALECLACGKQVISTNYSGHTEFLNTSNSHLIELPDREKAYDGVFFSGGGNWAKWTSNACSELSQKMRFVFENKLGTNDAGIKTSQNFTWKESGMKLVKVLKENE